MGDGVVEEEAAVVEEEAAAVVEGEAAVLEGEAAVAGPDPAAGADPGPRGADTGIDTGDSTHTTPVTTPVFTGTPITFGDTDGMMDTNPKRWWILTRTRSAVVSRWVKTPSNGLLQKRAGSVRHNAGPVPTPPIVCVCDASSRE